MNDLDFSHLEPLSRPVREHSRRWVVPVLIAALVVLLVSVARADDFQCYANEGCVALMPSPGGTKEVRFKKGDIIGTSQGWIPLPGGWREIDFALIDGELWPG